MDTDKHRGNFKLSSVFICVHLWLLCFCAQADWKISPVSSLQKLTAIAPGVLESFKSEPVKLRAVRGEWENFQVVAYADKEAHFDLMADVSDLWSLQRTKIGSENIHVYLENYVEVKHPSGNRRLQKLWWPDALIPLSHLNDPLYTEPNKSRVLWFNVQVPLSTEPGTYYGAIHFLGQPGSMPRLNVEIKVEDRVLPPPTLRANVAVYYNVLRDWYAKNADPISDAGFESFKRFYYDFLLDYRINAYDLPVDWKSDAAQKYLQDPRVLSVRMPPLDRADFNDALAAFKKANALEKAYYYWIDEPTPEHYETVKNVTQKLRQLGIKHCVTAHPNQSLNGAVDIWCPNIGDFFGLKHLDSQMLAAQRKKGYETWLYTMAWPRHPYPTWLLDDDASAIRSYGSLMHENGITGFVYSMAHGWGPKPLENLQSFGETNGDGTLLYPAAVVERGNPYPLPSIRLMLLRDAIEDYELKRHFSAPHFLMVDLDSKPHIGWRLQFKPGTLPQIDGHLKDAAWNRRTLFRRSLQRLPGETAPVSTQVWLAHNQKNLLVAARCPLMPRAWNGEVKGEWFCLDFAPLRADMHWRFIITPSGKGIVEKHSREGHFRIENIKWKFAAKATRDFYNIEMQIPLEEINLEHGFAFNARRRFHDTQLNIHYLLNAFADAENVALMPRVILQ